MLIATSRKRAKGPAYYRRAAFLSNRNRELDGLQIRGGQFAALAHNVVADLLSLIEVAHAGAFDRGNVDEYIFPAILRLYEAKALLGIEDVTNTKTSAVLNS